MRFYAHREADEELTAAVEAYDGACPGLGTDFLDEVEAGLARIRQTSETWPRIPGTRVRRHWIKRFPYGLVYWVHLDEIQLVAVMHAKRRPGYWAVRLS